MLGSAFSQSSSPPGTTTLTTASTTHTIAVGAVSGFRFILELTIPRCKNANQLYLIKDGYNFTPNQLNANAGDIIGRIDH